MERTVHASSFSVQGSLTEMEFQGLYHESQRPKYDSLLFDLDDTLYPLSSGIAKGCLRNIQDYMVEKLGIDESQLDALCNLLYKNYGTTMAGLRGIGYDLDYDSYHSFVHGRLPYENLKPDPVLRSLLLSLPYRKIIFTNADKTHSAKVLDRLDLEDCFEGIICFEALNPMPDMTASSDEGGVEFVETSKSTDNGSPQIFDIISHFSEPDLGSELELPKTRIICKPSEDAIGRALKIANVNPQRTIFFDDSVRNIQAAKRVGLVTVLVGSSHRCKGADYALESIHNLREALPELWDADLKSEVGYSSNVAVETSVTA